MTANAEELRRALLDRTASDQDARQALIQWMNDHGSIQNFDKSRLSEDKQVEYAKVLARVREVDAENTDWLKGVVEKHGWLGKSLVGADGARSAWMLIQHSDTDLQFQRRCLDLMTELPKGDVPPSNLAYLTDRVLLAEGKHQLYGTQFTFTDGRCEPAPIVDPANVDKRRAEAGLPSLAQYAQQLQQQYGARAR